MVEDALYSILRADAGVTGWVGDRVYFMEAPQEVTLPALVYQRIDTDRGMAHDGPEGYAVATFQITCMGTLGQAPQVAEAVRQALHGYRGEVAGVQVWLASVMGDRDVFVPAIEGGSVQLDVEIQFREV